MALLGLGHSTAAGRRPAISVMISIRGRHWRAAQLGCEQRDDVNGHGSLFSRSEKRRDEFHFWCIRVGNYWVCIVVTLRFSVALILYRS